ncbi:MAG: hypothetical protein DRP28_01880, partial [Thermodesulfobacteriota bacterium]
QTASTATGHTGELLLPTCSRPLFSEAFATWETLPRSPPLRSGAGGFPCCKDQENCRADANRFQKELPCVTGCCRSGLPFYGVLGSGPDCTAFSVCNG